ncbi:hypothetical protein [Marinobacter sp.]|uniref:hypothetical protein n=1 Tax=Marinobacter sp. TaxID=50741 RepID=UPI003A93DD50
MPQPKPASEPHYLVPASDLARWQSFAFDLEILLKFLSDERNLASDDKLTLARMLAERNLDHLYPICEQMEAAQADSLMIVELPDKSRATANVRR